MPGGHSSLTPAVILPRVTTAPGKLDSSSPIHARAITRAKPPPILSQHHPLMDNSELESQINTLSLLHAHGYGPVPGTPLLRSKTAASIGTGRRHPPQVKARASTTKSETRGARLGRSRDLIQAADRQGNGANVGGNVRERWRGPMEHATRSGQAAGSHVIPQRFLLKHEQRGTFLQLQTRVVECETSVLELETCFVEPEVHVIELETVWLSF